LDEKAVSTFRGLAPDLQAKVVARGDLGGARNMSASLLGRIRDARTSLSCDRLAENKGGPTEDELDAFISENALDEEASKALREAPPAVQTGVLARGDLAGARSPSAMVLGRLRDARKNVIGQGWASSSQGGGGGAVQMNGGVWIPNAAAQAIPMNGGMWIPMGAMGRIGKGQGGGGGNVNVEQFISAGNLDDKAIAALREAPPAVQAAVVNRGEVSSARNPSATVLSRIKDARTGADPSGGGGGGGGGCMMKGGGKGGGGGMGMGMGRPMMPMMPMMGMMGMGGGMGGMPGMWGGNGMGMAAKRRKMVQGMGMMGEN
jgi:hypothetical protein